MPAASSSAASTSAARRAPLHVVRPQDATAERDAERVSGDRRLAALPHLEVEQHAEEPLVRRRQQDRVAERNERRGRAQQHERLRLASCRGRGPRRR